MDVTVRRATVADTLGMSEVLCEIIRIGGTTAFLDPVSPADIEGWMARNPGRSSWMVAEDETGRTVGFQYADVSTDLPEDCANIASFVRVGVTGGGIGSKLFDATCSALREIGYRQINATIRSDNESGLSFYAKIGFKDHNVDPLARLSDGRVTGKTHKRYQL